MNAVGNPDRRWDSFTEAYDATPFETLGKIPKSLYVPSTAWRSAAVW